MDSPTVSVITVCLNAQSELEKTFESLAGQLSTDFEWIVVDGSSTDGTVEFLKNNCSSTWIHWVSKRDKGIYDAMNNGIKLAKGRYIWFINCGDRLHDERAILNLAKLKPHCDVAFGEVIVDTPEGFPSGKRSEVTPHTLPTSLQKELFQCGMIVSHQAFVVSRERAPLFDTRYRLSSDLDWMLRILDANPRTMLLPTMARIAYPGASNQMWYRSQWERFKILARHFGLLRTLVNHVKIAARRIKFASKTNRWR